MFTLHKTTRAVILKDHPIVPSPTLLLIDLAPGLHNPTTTSTFTAPLSNPEEIYALADRLIAIADELQEKADNEALPIPTI